MKLEEKVIIQLSTIGIVTAGLFALVGCPQPPAPAPMPPDATDAMSIPESGLAACVLACQQLAAVGCSEGSAPTCVRSLTTIEILKTEPNKANGNLPLQCSDFAMVKTAADVTKMGEPCTVH